MTCKLIFALREVDSAWLFSKGPTANVVDSGRVFSFHVFPGFQDRWGQMLWPLRKGEYLEDAAVESDKILLDQLISGLEVIIEAHLQKGAKLVVAVEGKAMTIGNQDEKEIEQQFMMGKSAPEPVTEEPMFDGGEAPLDGTQSLRDKRFFVDHGLAPFGLEANTQHRRELSSPLLQSPSMGRNPLAQLGLFGLTRPFLQSPAGGKKPLVC
jgi:hypothetical protein